MNDKDNPLSKQEEQERILKLTGFNPWVNISSGAVVSVDQKQAYESSKPIREELNRLWNEAPEIEDDEDLGVDFPEAK